MIGVLVMAYGGPNNLDEVEPYLLDVRGGRPTAPELVAEIRERYARIGGRSPLLDITQEQAAALGAMEELTDITSNSISGKDKIIASAAVDALKDFTLQYLKRKPQARSAAAAAGD